MSDGVDATERFDRIMQGVAEGERIAERHVDERRLRDALEPSAIQRQVETLINTPAPTEGGQLDVAARADSTGAQGVEGRVSAGGSWWSAAAWGQWMRDRGWSAAGVGSLRWGRKR